MPYLRLAPAPPLDRVVDHLWVFEDHEVPTDTGLLFADGRGDLMFHLTGTILLHDERGVSRWSGGWASGQRTRAIRIELLSRRFTMVGARLRATGFGALLGAPASELPDDVLELRQFWRGDAAELTERLATARSAAARLACLHDALLRRLRVARLPTPALLRAVEALRRDPCGQRIDHLRARLGVSHRHLVRLFREHVGLAPKQFQRVSRFRRLLDAVELGGAPDWARLAAAHGYSDQAHLAREFREFTGLSPGRYRPPPMPAPEYMPRAL